MAIISPDSISLDNDFLSRFIAGIGKAVAWLTLIMVLLTFAIVVLRYGFNLGWIWLQESLSYLHGMVFMLAAAWALQTDDHVRVDIYYRDSSPRHKAIINLIGALIFLVPFCVFILLISWDYVAVSWVELESSREAGGLDLVFLQKSLILLLPVLLLLQAVQMVRHSVLILRQDHTHA